MKSLFTSKTFWLAVLQGAVGVWAVIAADPAFVALGWVAMVKSGLDIVLRLLTTQQVFIK